MNLSPSLPIDLSRLVETRMLVQGSSGSGKTVAVKRLLEQTHGKVQHLVLDVEDEYPPLREKFDYVLAGGGRDCPADARSAALLARKLLELGQSAIVNLHELKAPERAKVVRLFIESLMSAPKALWRDVLVVVEECHLWAPQSGREAESTSAVIDLATRGRKRGFAIVAVTQRISDLHKSVVAQAGNRLIGKTTLDADMKRAAYELGFSGREQAQDLARLGRGEFFGVGPALSDLVVRSVISPISTTHGSARGARAAAPPPPREAVKRILAELADLPAEAELEARTVEDLRGKVGRLERELAAAKRAAVVQPVQVVRPELLEQARAEGRAVAGRAARDQLSKVVASAEAGRGRAARAIAKGREHYKLAAEAFQAAEDALREPIDVPEMGTPAALPADFVESIQTKRKIDAVAREFFRQQLGAERRLLEVLVSRAPARFTRAQLGTLAGLAWKGGTFSTYLSRLRTAGYLDEEGDLLGASEAGISACGGAPPAPASPEEVQATWRRALGEGAAGRLLDALIAQRDEWIRRDELAEACGLAASGGTFSTYLSRLRSNGLLEEKGSEIRAAAVLFEA